jgi:hypothetical protein
VRRITHFEEEIRFVNLITKKFKRASMVWYYRKLVYSLILRERFAYFDRELKNLTYKKYFDFFNQKGTQETLRRFLRFFQVYGSKRNRIYWILPANGAAVISCGLTCTLSMRKLGPKRGKKLILWGMVIGILWKCFL